MCFSATASFTLSSILLPLGGWCLQKAWRGDRRLLPLAAFPFAFGLQQAIEGGVWLGLAAQDPVLINQAARGFVVFSHGFWLCWTPFMVARLETQPRQRQVWNALMLMGLALGLYLVLPVLLHPDWLTVERNHQTLVYTLHLLMAHPFLIQAGRVLYTLIILGPLLLTTTPSVQRLGWLILAAFLLTTRFFPYGFISIWCFFAAIASIYIGYLFTQRIASNTYSLGH